MSKLPEMQKKGLWSHPVSEQVPPWEWRQGVKTNKEVQEGDNKEETQNFTCGTKSYCKEMASCEEARWVGV